MDIDIRKLAFAIAVCLLALWRVKRGFKNGILKEIVNILSGAISLVCVALVFYAVSSVMAGAMSTLTVCVIALIVLGILFKVCNLIFKPILALGDVAVWERCSDLWRPGRSPMWYTASVCIWIFTFCRRQQPLDIERHRLYLVVKKGIGKNLKKSLKIC